MTDGHGTNPWQQMVAEFHDAMELPVGDSVALRMPELRASLLAEEVAETIAAMGFMVTVRVSDRPTGRFDDVGREPIFEVTEGVFAPGPDMVEVIDGLCDVIYVALGAAATFGIDLDPFFREVQRSNMAKAGGAVREDGKRLKPEGWTPPDIAGILTAQSEFYKPEPGVRALYKRLAAEYEKQPITDKRLSGAPGDRFDKL